jgi:hypothetical protein
MTYLLALIIGILSSFTSALIFLFFLSRVRPTIHISSEIARYERHGIEDGKQRIRFIIKVINRKKRPLINIKARLDLINRVNVYGGWINNRREIPLKINSVFEIPGFNPTAEAESYTWRFITYEDLDVSWENDRSQFLRFQIYAVDSLSNFAAVFTKDFFTKRNIVDGDFEFGDSLRVK